MSRVYHGSIDESAEITQDNLYHYCPVKVD